MIKDALAAGTSFENVVKQFSEDKNVDNGGLQEPFAPNRRQGDFVKAVLSLQPGQISQPIASQNGWHIVQLVETKSVSLDDDAMYTLRNRISRDERSHKSKESHCLIARRTSFSPTSSPRTVTVRTMSSSSRTWIRRFPICFPFMTVGARKSTRRRTIRPTSARATRRYTMKMKVSAAKTSPMDVHRHQVPERHVPYL